MTRKLLLFSNSPKTAAPLFHRDSEWWHAVGCHSTLALRLYLAACNPFSRCRSKVLDHLCSNLFQPRAIVIPFHSCWTTESRYLNLCVYFCLFLFCLFFSDKIKFQLSVTLSNFVVNNRAISLLLLLEFNFLAVPQILDHSDTCAVPCVCNAVGLVILLKLSPAFASLQQLVSKGLRVIYTFPKQDTLCVCCFGVIVLLCSKVFWKCYVRRGQNFSGQTFLNTWRWPTKPASTSFHVSDEKLKQFKTICKFF